MGVMKKTYEELIVKDENGNVVLEQHADGFREVSEYYNGKLVKQVTRYSNGIIETSHYTYPKEVN